jgi:hypothetical protein
MERTQLLRYLPVLHRPWALQLMILETEGTENNYFQLQLRFLAYFLLYRLRLKLCTRKYSPC